jgi:hypothetical protein
LTEFLSCGRKYIREETKNVCGHGCEYKVGTDSGSTERDRSSYSPRSFGKGDTSLFSDNVLLSSCLIGSPQRAHDNEDDILAAIPRSQTECIDRSDTSSKVLGLLNKLKKEVKALKASRGVADKANEMSSPPPKRSSKVLANHSPKRSPSAREKLRDIELLLLEAEDSTQWLQDRLDRIKTVSGTD